MDRSNQTSGVLRASVRCEGLESLQLFADIGIDKTFGTGGKVVTTFGGAAELATAVESLKDGRVAAAGYGYFSDGQHLLLAVYDAKVKLSPAFDKDGKLTLSAATTAKVIGDGEVNDLI